MLRICKKKFRSIENYEDTSQEELRGKEVNEEYSESENPKLSDPIVYTS